MQDGVITAGSADKKQPRNEFLSTKADYGDFASRGRRIIDTTTQGVEAAGQAARKAAVDYKRLADESARFNSNANRPIATAASFRPARPGQYADPIAIEEQERLAANAAARARMSARIGGGGGGGDHPGGGGFGRRMAGDAINLLTGTSGNAMRLSGLGAIGVGIGASAGILAFVAAATKLHSVLEKGLESYKSFAKELSQPIGVDRSGLLEQIKHLKELETEARKANKPLDMIQRGLDLIPGVSAARRAADGGDGEERVARIRRLSKQRSSELQDSLISRGADELGLAREKAFGSSSVAATAEAGLETAKKIAEIRANQNLSEQTKTRLIQQENDLLTIQEQKIEAAAAVQERQYTLSQKLNNFRSDGGHSEVDAAKERVAAALSELDAAKAGGNDEARKAATDKLGAEVANLAVAQNQEAVIESSVRVARFRGSAEEKIAFSLDEQLKRARETLDVKQREKAVSEALRDIEDNRTAQAMRRYQLANATEKLAISRRTSRADVTASPEQTQRNDLIAGIEAAKSNFNAAQKAYLRRPDKDTGATQNEAFTELLNAKDRLAKFERDTAFANKQELDAAKATTAELGLQAQGRNVEAQRVATIAGYQQQIALAIKNGKNDIAAQLQMQEKVALISQRAAELGKSPEELQAERDQQRRSERLFRTAGAQMDDEADRKSRGAYARSPDAYNGPNDPSDPNGRPYTPQLGRPPETSVHGAPYEIQLGKYRTPDEDFHDQFKPLSQQAKGAFDGAHAAAEKGGSNSGNGSQAVLNKVDSLISTLNALPGKIGVI